MSLEIGDQPGAVGIVTQQHAIISQFDGVDRSRPLGPGAQPLHQHEGLLLERYGHVAPLPSFGEEVVQSAGKLIDSRFCQTILQRLLGLPGKQGMNEGRFAVAHGVAKNQITIHQGVPFEGNIPI